MASLRFKVKSLRRRALGRIRLGVEALQERLLDLRAWWRRAQRQLTAVPLRATGAPRARVIRLPSRR